MKKRHYYKTLRGLFAANGIDRMYLGDYLTKTIRKGKEGEMIFFTLSEDADAEVRNLFASAIVNGKESQERCAKPEMLAAFTNLFGLFACVAIEKSDNGFFAHDRSCLRKSESVSQVLKRDFEAPFYGYRF